MAALSSYTPITTQTLSSGSTSVTFNSFTGYTDLVLVCNVYGTANYSGFIRFNGDTGSNYSSTTLQGNGSTATSGRATSDTSIYIMTKGVGFDPSYLTTGIINIQNYSNSTTYKTVLSRSGVVRASVGETTAFVGTWRNTAAITSFTIISDGGTYASGSTFSLYGIANNTAGAKATGGVISSDSNYFYHSFYATDTFTPTQSLSCDYLVVAGGGGGGTGDAGGGGAGGYRTSIGNSPLSVTATGYTITVGAGGTAASYSPWVQASNGGDSTFSTITSTGGGRGGTLLDGANFNSGNNGGSGGGQGRPGYGSAGTGNTPSTTPSQGNNGGNGTGAPNYFGGGGGGSSSAGSGATGGSGTSNSITGLAVTYAAGGTGAQLYSGGPSATISSGNGGNGAGKGGSGVVIIRYAR